MAMVPYMAGGYAIDRMMGGDGKIGLALGTGAGAFGTGAIGGSALGGATASTSASTSPLLFSTPATAGGSGLGALGGAGMYEAGTLGTVNPLTTGGFSESISPFTPQGSEFGIAGSTNLFGSPISKLSLNKIFSGTVFFMSSSKLL